MAIKITDLGIMHQLPPWSVIPGTLISADYANAHKSHDLAKKAYQFFINKKIPLVTDLVGQLRQQHYISQVHLPLSLRSIFFVFLDELVALYQNQIDHSDEEIKQSLLNIKLVYAQRSAEQWDQNPRDFFAAIKMKLDREGALPPEFDNVIAIWSKILSIKHMGDLTLASLYEKSIRRPRNGDTYPHCILSYPDLKESYFLLSKQICEDSSWVFSEIERKIRPIKDKQLEYIIRLITANNGPFSEESFYLSVEKHLKEGRERIKKLTNIDITDNAHIDEVVNLLKTETPFKINLSQILKEIMEDREKASIFLGKITVRASDALIAELKSYQYCFSIESAYLGRISIQLLLILTSLKRANDTWDEVKMCQKSTLPLIDIPPLLPSIAPAIPMDEDWLNSPGTYLKTSQQQRFCKKKKFKNPGTPAKRVLLQNPSVESPPPVISTQTSVLTPLEKLRLKLKSFYLENPSPALRQALWHLDFLFVISDSITPFDPSHCLILAVMVAGHSQKVLEQTYRFCIKEENSRLERGHDLKAYHRKLEPNFKSYPSIVKDLFLANNWCRYFYSEQDKWKRLTTRAIAIPSVLTTLVQIAEGNPLSPQQLEGFTRKMIEDVRAHVEFLIGKTNVSFTTEGFAEPLVIPKMIQESVRGFDAAQGRFLNHFQYKPPVALKKFDEVSNNLRDFLAQSKLNPGHSSVLSIHQALAALTMLKAGQKKIEQSKDIVTLSTWTVWSLQQLQESTENILHAIEYFQFGTTSMDHEIGKLAEKVELDIGPLATVFHCLSYKVRYPAEHTIDTPSAKIIDDLEAMKQHPEILEGFDFQALSPMLWASPGKGISPTSTALQLNEMMVASEDFLRVKALPALKKYL